MKKRHSFVRYTDGPYRDLYLCKACGHSIDHTTHRPTGTGRTGIPTIRDVLHMTDEELPHIPSQIIDLLLIAGERHLYKSKPADIPRALAICSFLHNEWDRY